MGLGGTRSDYTPPYEFLTKNPNFGRTRKPGEKTARIPNVLLVLISARIPNVPRPARRSSSTLPCFLVVVLLTLISASSRPHLIGDSLLVQSETVRRNKRTLKGLFTLTIGGGQFLGLKFSSSHIPSHITEIHGRIYVVPRPPILCINIWRRLWESTRKIMSALSQFFTSAKTIWEIRRRMYDPQHFLESQEKSSNFRTQNPGFPWMPTRPRSTTRLSPHLLTPPLPPTAISIAFSPNTSLRSSFSSSPSSIGKVA
ncbi:hypothetical protein ACFX2B_030295 [Malus domestica]